MTTPRSRPILFSAPMVRAIINGRKTQTRRLLSNLDWIPVSGGFDPVAVPRAYGGPGDFLWVREEHYRFGHWEQIDGTRQRTRTGRQRWKFVADVDDVRFDAPSEFRKGRHHKDPATPAWHKRIARFMPRAFSRITLEVTEVRVQRLQEISGEDAAEEGISVTRCGCEVCSRSSAMCPADASAHVEEFACLWDSINGDRAPWSSNCWVWCIAFRRLQ